MRAPEGCAFGTSTLGGAGVLRRLVSARAVCQRGQGVLAVLRRSLPSALLRQLDLNTDKEKWRLTRHFPTQFPPTPKVFECIPSGSPFGAQYLTDTPF